MRPGLSRTMVSAMRNPKHHRAENNLFKGFYALFNTLFSKSQFRGREREEEEVMSFSLNSLVNKKGINRRN